jgi:hypothetical protein
MPAFLENKLEREAAAKGLKGKAAARYTFGTLNNIGAMKGSAETAKGAEMQRKHDEKVESAADRRYRRRKT